MLKIFFWKKGHRIRNVDHRQTWYIDQKLNMMSNTSFSYPSFSPSGEKILFAVYTKRMAAMFEIYS